jgi:cobalamin biosynthesis protein CobW
MKIPCTIITGFLGAGKTTLVRHVLAHANGRRIAILVNEFGSLGIDGETLRSCGIPGCDDIVELANGCLCCTVADEFIPAMEALLNRPNPPEHILIETSGLALPKPLLKAFGWPGIRSRVTVDGVITVVDGPAVAAGRFADDPAAVAAQRAADEQLDHDNPLSEVYLDQIQCADLVILNKTDLLDAASLNDSTTMSAGACPRSTAGAASSSDFVSRTSRCIQVPIAAAMAARSIPVWPMTTRWPSRFSASFQARS